MIRSGFFNAVNNDRLYNADDMSNYFNGLISNGVFKNIGGAFQVISGNGMTVQVLDGRAIIDCKWVTNDTFENITLDNADDTYNRIDAIILRLNNNNRQITLTYLKGEPSSSPVAPTILDTDIRLANITVAVGASAITTSNIIDKRIFVKSLTSSLVKYQNIINVSEASTTFNIGISEYDSETDVLEVYHEGIYQIENVDYTINTSTIITTNSISSGTLAFIVHKIIC